MKERERKKRERKKEKEKKDKKEEKERAKEVGEKRGMGNVEGRNTGKKDIRRRS